MRIAHAGRPIACLGAAAQLLGLGWDAVLHRADPELAAREGIFTLTNPGHLLFAGGIALVVLGLGLMLLGDLPRRGPARFLRFGAAGMLAALSLGSGVLAAAGEGGEHAHTTVERHVHEDGAVHTQEEHDAFVQQGAAQPGATAGHAHAPAGSAVATGAAAGSSRHDAHAEVPVSSGELLLLNEQLATARAATEQYQDIRVALQAGFIPVTQDLPGIAAHLVQPAAALDGVFDPARPEILLFAKQEGRWTLVGLSYLMALDASAAPPAGFAGPLDVWHYHTGLCFRGQSVISQTLSQAECSGRGGRFVKNTGWQMHLWLYQEGPEGLFAHENSLLKGSGAVLTRAEIASLP